MEIIGWVKYFFFSPKKDNPTEYSWNRVVRTIGSIINLMLSLLFKYNHLIPPCSFFKKEGTLNYGMKLFWWKYSDVLNQNLNPQFELNLLMLDIRLMAQDSMTEMFYFKYI